MDAEFPRFSQRLLDLVYPSYLSPTPAMGIAQFHQPKSEGGSPDGFTLPKHSRMRARLPAQEQTACEFRTAHELTLWPLNLVEARLTAAPPDLPIAGYRWGAPVRGALRLTFETTAQTQVSALKLDSLPLFINGNPDTTTKLQELIHTQCLGLMVHRSGLPIRDLVPLEPSALKAEGFSSEQAILPLDSRAFEGHRLLHEYFAFPERYRFFSVGGLQRALRKIDGTRFEIVILLKAANAALEAVIDKANFALHTGGEPVHQDLRSHSCDVHAL
jgi:type VI secretion system protein ImpG